MCTSSEVLFGLPKACRRRAELRGGRASGAFQHPRKHRKVRVFANFIDHCLL